MGPFLSTMTLMCCIKCLTSNWNSWKIFVVYNWAICFSTSRTDNRFRLVLNEWKSSWTFFHTCSSKHYHILDENSDSGFGHHITIKIRTHILILLLSRYQPNMHPLLTQVPIGSCLHIIQITTHCLKVETSQSFPPIPFEIQRLLSIINNLTQFITRLLSLLHFASFSQEASSW